MTNPRYPFAKALGGLAHLFTLTPWLRRPAAKQARKLREWQRLAAGNHGPIWNGYCAENIGHHAGRLFALREAAYNGKTPYRKTGATNPITGEVNLDEWVPSLTDATEPRPVSIATLGNGYWVPNCQRWACAPYHDLTRIGPGAVSGVAYLEMMKEPSPEGWS
jgi:hypothetical protein